MSASPILELRNVHKRFGDKEVLRGVDLTVAPGRSLVIIGGSGTGKSVTIKCALGLMTPDQGEVLFDGEPASSRSAIAALRRRTGMLFQGGALFDSLTVWENVAFALIYRDGVGRGEAKKRAIETLAKVRLGASAADLRPAELSGGMQKRVALARAIIAKPDLIFFDEPTTGLDPITADAVNNLIVEQVKALGAAAVSITHDMASVRKIADEVAMLHEAASSGGARSRSSTRPAAPISISSSTAAPKARSSRRSRPTRNLPQRQHYDEARDAPSNLCQADAASDWRTKEWA
ncbi:MAG TPA: ATP-binding cassette domain-containing protein [Hyphomonadaceae bacterium]